MAIRASRTTMPQAAPTYSQGEVCLGTGRPVYGSMSHLLRDGNPQELAQALEAAAEDLHRRQARGAHLRVLLLKDGVSVVEGVEALREVEGVAGDQRELQALRRLL